MNTITEMVEDTSEGIVIVGGGICGLATALALALHRKGIRSLVERSESLRATGAASALDQLGVASYLRQTADPILSGQFNSLDSNKLEKMPVGDNLPQNILRLGRNVVSIELDPITSFPVLQLQDGSSLNAKVVIGCDGVNSGISDMMGVMATNIFNLCATRGFTSYPSGHEFGSEFKLTIKDDIQVGLMPMTTNLTAEFKISQSQKLIGNMAAASVQDFPPSIKEMVENCSSESLTFFRNT